MRLPRRFSAFDYRLPPTTNYVIGDVVIIPFRNQNILGVISEITESSSVKKVLTLTDSPPLFRISATHLHFLHQLALSLGQSFSTILSTAYEGLSRASGTVFYSSAVPKQSFTTKKTTATKIQNFIKNHEGNIPIALAATEEETAVLAHSLCSTTMGQVLIIVPQERVAQFYFELLQSFRPRILTGKTKKYERDTIIRSWKNGKLPVLIGTRQSVLIEPNNLHKILIVQAASEDHTNALRNPHIHACIEAQHLAHLYQAHCIFADALPPILADIPNTTSFNTNSTDVHVIDVMNPGERSEYPLLSQTTLLAIKMALQSQKKVLLSLNRKGVAARLECKECGHVPFCGTCGSLPIVRQEDLLCGACGTEMWKPVTCPACKSTKIGPKKIGGARIIADLQRAFPETTVGQIEKGRVEDSAQILVATEYFWSGIYTPFHRFHFGLVVELLVDVGFIPGDFRGAEKTARKIQRLRNLASHEEAECIVQTVARDRILSLLGPKHVYTSELEIRRKYRLPPFGAIVKFEKALVSELPKDIVSATIDRQGILTAKITHEKLVEWYKIFPTLPDHINIRIDSSYVQNRPS